MNSCNKYREQLALWEESEALSLHLQQCAACQQVAGEIHNFRRWGKSIRQIDEKHNSLPSLPDLTHLKQFSLRQSLAFALTGFFLVLSLSLGSYFILNKSRQGHLQEVKIAMNTVENTSDPDLFSIFDRGYALWSSATGELSTSTTKKSSGEFALLFDDGLENNQGMVSAYTSNYGYDDFFAEENEFSETFGLASP